MNEEQIYIKSAIINKLSIDIDKWLIDVTYSFTDIAYLAIDIKNQFNDIDKLMTFIDTDYVLLISIN